MSDNDAMVDGLQAFNDALSDLFLEMNYLKKELHQIGETLGRMEAGADPQGSTSLALATAAENFRGVFNRLYACGQLSEMIDNAANDDAGGNSKDKVRG